MAILSTPVEKAEKRIADIDVRIPELQAQQAAEPDFDRKFALGEEVEKMKRMRALAVEALGTAKAMEAEEAKRAAKANAGAAIEAYRREAKREAPSRLNKIAKLQEALAPELDWLKTHVERADEVNRLAREFGFPGVSDGEMLFRGKPTRVIPAQFEEREVLRDQFGRQPGQYREVDGVIYSHDGGICTKRRERVQVRGETVEPGGIPGGRIAPAVRLVNLNGQQIWPLR